MKENIKIKPTVHSQCLYSSPPASVCITVRVVVPLCFSAFLQSLLPNSSALAPADRKALQP